jgi:hypothetical protein
LASTSLSILELVDTNQINEKDLLVDCVNESTRPIVSEPDLHTCERGVESKIKFYLLKK